MLHSPISGDLGLNCIVVRIPAPSVGCRTLVLVVESKHQLTRGGSKVKTAGRGERHKREGREGADSGKEGVLRGTWRREIEISCGWLRPGDPLF